MTAQSNACMTSASANDVLLSVRETRLIVERILLLTDLPPGGVAAVRELILAGEAIGKPALRHLLSHFEPLRGMNPARLKLKGETAESLSVDADGEHAWAVGPALLDLAVDLCRRHGRGEVLVENLRERDFLAALPMVALRYGANLTVTNQGTSAAMLAVIDRRPDQAEQTNELDPFLTSMLRDGFKVPRGLWSELYHLSNQSLTPDSVVSRRHAGPIIIDENGRIIGRTDDDETDFSLLSKLDPSTEAA